MEGGKVEQEPKRGKRDDSSPGKEDHPFQEMKEQVKMLKKQVGKLQKENLKVKEFAVSMEGGS